MAVGFSFVFRRRKGVPGGFGGGGFAVAGMGLGRELGGGEQPAALAALDAAFEDAHVAVAGDLQHGGGVLEGGVAVAVGGQVGEEVAAVDGDVAVDDHGLAAGFCGLPFQVGNEDGLGEILLDGGDGGFLEVVFGVAGRVFEGFGHDPDQAFPVIGLEPCDQVFDLAEHDAAEGVLIDQRTGAGDADLFAGGFQAVAGVLAFDADDAFDFEAQDGGEESAGVGRVQWEARPVVGRLFFAAVECVPDGFGLGRLGRLLVLIGFGGFFGGS